VEITSVGGATHFEAGQATTHLPSPLPSAAHPDLHPPYPSYPGPLHAQQSVVKASRMGRRLGGWINGWGGWGSE